MLFFPAGKRLKKVSFAEKMIQEKHVIKLMLEGKSTTVSIFF